MHRSNNLHRCANILLQIKLIKVGFLAERAIAH